MGLAQLRVVDDNVLGDKLRPCSTEPMTGYERDGFCRAVSDDLGRHEICAVVTEPFLDHSRERGNDLVTPRPELGFPGLEPGDRWCVCVSRWREALAADAAPPVVLESTNAAVLEEVSLETLRAHAADE